MSSSLEELKEEDNNLIELLSNDTIQKNSYVYKEIELEPKQKDFFFAHRYWLCQ